MHDAIALCHCYILVRFRGLGVLHVDLYGGCLPHPHLGPGGGPLAVVASLPGPTAVESSGARAPTGCLRLGCCSPRRGKLVELVPAPVQWGPYPATAATLV